MKAENFLNFKYTVFIFKDSEIYQIGSLIPRHPVTKSNLIMFNPLLFL